METGLKALCNHLGEPAQPSIGWQRSHSRSGLASFSPEQAGGMKLRTEPAAGPGAEHPHACRAAPLLRRYNSCGHTTHLCGGTTHTCAGRGSSEAGGRNLHAHRHPQQTLRLYAAPPNAPPAPRTQNCHLNTFCQRQSRPKRNTNPPGTSSPSAHRGLIPAQIPSTNTGSCAKHTVQAAAGAPPSSGRAGSTRH